MYAVLRTCAVARARVQSALVADIISPLLLMGGGCTLPLPALSREQSLKHLNGCIQFSLLRSLLVRNEFHEGMGRTKRLFLTLCRRMSSILAQRSVCPAARIASLAERL